MEALGCLVWASVGGSAGVRVPIPCNRDGSVEQGTGLLQPSPSQPQTETDWELGARGGQDHTLFELLRCQPSLPLGDLKFCKDVDHALQLGPNGWWSGPGDSMLWEWGSGVPVCGLSALLPNSDPASRRKGVK